MASRTLLINEADIRNFTDIGNNYNKTSLSNAVIKAQNIELQEITGKRLIEKLQADIENGVAFVAPYSTLSTEYINPYLIQASYFYLLETLYATPRSRGLGKRTGSASSAALTSVEYHEKRNIVRAEIDFHGKRLAEYLSTNSSLFVELTSTTEISSDAPNLEQISTNTPLIARSGTSGQSALIRKRSRNNNPFR